MFPCPRSRLRIWTRETGSAVPSRVNLLISILRLNLVLTYGIPPDFRGGVHLFISNRHTPSGQSRVYRVTQLRTGGVHCRESAGTGPVNLQVIPNECCLGRSPWTSIMCLSFPHPLCSSLEGQSLIFIYQAINMSLHKLYFPSDHVITVVILFSGAGGDRQNSFFLFS